LREASGIHGATLSLIVVLVPVVVVGVSTLVSIGSGTIAVLIVVVLAVEILRSSLVVEISERHAAVTHLLLEKKEDLLDELNGVGLLEKIGINLVGGILLSLVVEVSLVLGLSLLLLADLGKLIVGHVEWLSVDLLSVKLLSGKGGTIRLLEADEGAAGRQTVVSRQNLDVFDLTELNEMLSNFLFLVFNGEVLDEEIALLLGVLESLLLSLNHSLSLNGGQGLLNVKTLGIIEFLNGLISCSETLCSIGRIEETNESKFAIRIFGIFLDKNG
jgi:hypothetical protein